MIGLALNILAFLFIAFVLLGIIGILIGLSPFLVFLFNRPKQNKSGTIKPQDKYILSPRVKNIVYVVYILLMLAGLFFILAKGEGIL
jgi:hypothetical protein